MEKKTKQDKQLAAKHELWRRGELIWKLKGKQKNIYNHFKNSNDDITTCLVSRQFGKSYTLLVISSEICVKNPNVIVKYACPTGKMVERIIIPRMNDIIKDCPDDLKPEWIPSLKVFKFPNGSEIQVAGTDNGNYDSLRGGTANLAIVDEAGFVDLLDTVVYSVLAPATDVVGGKIYLASTPNDKDVNHEFHTSFVHPAEAIGKLLKFTFYDSPMIDDEKRAKIIARYPGGIDNQKFRTEYLCEIPNISEASVIPEFAQNLGLIIVNDIKTPDYCNFYTSMDLGFVDLTCVLFGYYDFKDACLYIQDEYVINGSDLTTDKLHKEIIAREKIWYHTSTEGEKQPYLRISDNNLHIINDMSKFYNMTFIPTEKHNKDQAIDTVRRWFAQGKIKIHERCKNLIYHCRYAQWQYTKQGTFTGKFRHLQGSSDGELLKSHSDALDALIYLVRNIQVDNNPYPSNYGFNINSNTFVSPKWLAKNVSQATDFMEKILNIKKK